MVTGAIAQVHEVEERKLIPLSKCRVSDYTRREYFRACLRSDGYAFARVRYDPYGRPFVVARNMVNNGEARFLRYETDEFGEWYVIGKI